mmetsp:Transcript_10655/g.26109  ORF Transcript_10655/g.26109 Transcript_10655/m.26109 type:complete len:481 (-) Transcript_10655:238-1680(-)
MTSSPFPPGTSLENTSRKLRLTCLNVRSIASSFLWSRCDMSSPILTCARSNSPRRISSASRCSVNCWYWSSAFLLTCPSVANCSPVWASSACSALSALPRYFSNASEGREPSSRILRCSPSRLVCSVARLPISDSISRSSSARAALASSCSARRRSRFALPSRTLEEAAESLAAISAWRVVASASTAAAVAAAALARARSASAPATSTSLVTALMRCCRRSRLASSVARSSPRSASAASRAADAASRSCLSRSRRGLSSVSSAASPAVSCASSAVDISVRRSAACASRSRTEIRIADTAFSLTARDSPARAAAAAQSPASALRRSAAACARRRADSTRWMSPSTAVTDCSAACSLSFTPALSSLIAARARSVSCNVFMLSRRDRPESWYPPLIAPRLDTQSPSIVTQSRLELPANSTATSRLRQMSTLPNTLSMAGRNFSSKRILATMGKTLSLFGYSRVRTCRRLRGRKVTRPALSLLR